MDTTRCNPTTDTRGPGVGLQGRLDCERREGVSSKNTLEGCFSRVGEPESRHCEPVTGLRTETNRQV